MKRKPISVLGVIALVLAICATMFSCQAAVLMRNGLKSNRQAVEDTLR